jgi:ABC-type sugar transport system ATPase subunit
MIELRLEDLGKTFPPATCAVAHVNLTVAPGECLALLGASGCGKTTLLRLIAGLEQPTSGRILMDGACVNDVPSQRRDVAMLFQRPALIPQQTVRHNLGWAWTLAKPLASLFGAGRQHNDELLRVARLLDLERDLDRPIWELSGGQQQRVALGRCLLRKAGLVMLDEPLGHLDAPLRIDLRRQCRELAGEFRATTLHVTHDPEEAFAMGDRVAIMERGRIVQCDAPAAVRRAPSTRYVAELIHHQSGGMNLLAGRVHRDGMDTFFESPLGRWPMSVQIVEALRESLCAGENFHSGQGKVDIMIGVAVEDVRCTTAADGAGGEICLPLPIRRLESGDEVTVVVAGPESHRWVGHADVDERLEPGQSITMRFDLTRAYWFDSATGRTLSAPTG